MPYTKVKELPESLQNALRGVGYAKADIQILVKSSESVRFMGGDGYKGFATLVNMVTGEYKTLEGSWGGANMFNPTNNVDLDDKEYEIPENGAVIRGFTGGTSGITHCTITVSPKNAAPWLGGESELTEEEKHLLAIMRSYKPAYRKPYLAGKEDMVNSLVDRGYINRNKAGSLSLSTLGKNACENVRL